MPSITSPSPRPNMAFDHLFRRGFGTFRENALLCIMFSLVMLAASYVPTLLMKTVPGFGSPDFYGAAPSPSGALIVLLIMFVFGVFHFGPLNAGYSWVFLRLVRGESPAFAEVFAGFGRFGVAVGVTVLVGIAVGLGSVLLIVPGIIIALGLFAGPYLILDDDRGPLDTLARSWELTRGHKGRIFLVGLLLAILNGIPFFLLRGGTLALLEACNGILGPEDKSRVGTIVFFGDPVVIEVPDTVQVGVSFEVSVQTYGGGCLWPSHRHPWQVK